MEKKSGGPSVDLLWPTILSLALAVSGYLSIAPQFESERPQTTDEQSAPEKDAKVAVKEREWEYPSRLWEDPLGDAYQPFRRYSASPASTEPSEQTKLRSSKITKEPRIVVVTVPPGTKADDRELRLRTRYAIQAALGVAGYRPDAEDKINILPIADPRNDEAVTKNDLAHQVTRFVAEKLRDPFGVFLPAYHLVMNRALPNQASTKPINRGSSTNDGPPIWVPFELFRDDWARRVYGAEGSKEVRYKNILVFWLPADSSDHHVLREVGAIHNAVGKILFNGCWPRYKRLMRSDMTPEELDAEQTLEESRQDMPVQVIGPYNSDLLLAMTDELSKFKNRTRTWPPEFGRVQLYPWRNTVEFTALKEMPSGDSGDAAPQGERAQPTGSYAASSGSSSSDWTVVKAINLWRGLAALPEPGEASLKRTSSRDGLQLRVTPLIGTDWHLAHFVRQELCLRNAWPGHSMIYNSHDEDRPAVADGFIVLITEKDTLYGNTIPMLYESMLPKGPVAPGASRTPLIVYRYLQGVDGTSRLQEVQASKKGESVDQRQLEHAQGRDPQGNYQIDYLRRLADEIEQRNREMKAFGGRGVLAIGIMGSDVYDKLLVLRALRTRFPRVWFFTHDLDENFCRPSEMEYTQNLLVASHFGLALHPVLQREATPFRDSYQTSAFLAALMAVGDARTKDLLNWKDGPGKDQDRSVDLWPQPQALNSVDQSNRSADAAKILKTPPSYDGSQQVAPLMFEIGNGAAFQLTETGPRPSSVVYFPDDRPQDFSLQEYVQPPGSRTSQRWEWSKVVLATLALVFLVVLLTVNVAEIRNFVMRHVFRRVQSEKEQSNSASKTIAPADSPAENPPADGKSVSKRHICWILPACCVGLVVICIVVRFDHFSDGGQPFTLFAGVSAWPGIILRMFAIVLAVLFIYLTIDNFNERLDRALRDLHLVQETNAAPAIEKPIRIASWLREEWDILRNGLPHYDNLKDSVATYRRECSWRPRLLRSVLLALLYVLLAWCLLYISDSIPNAPIRGWVAASFSSVVVPLAGFALCWITFLVIDVERLAAQFTRALKELTAERLKKLDQPAEDIPFARRIVPMIAQRTNDTNKYVWYPFIIMSLLVIARQRVFTGDDYPLMLAIVQVVLLVALYFYNWRLRIEAQDARAEIVKQLKDRLDVVPSSIAEGRVKHSATKERTELKEQIERTIKDIESVDEGAFGHWTQDYFLKALALPFLGQGGFLLLQKWLAGG